MLLSIVLFSLKAPKKQTREFFTCKISKTVSSKVLLYWEFKDKRAKNVSPDKTAQDELPDLSRLIWIYTVSEFSHWYFWRFWCYRKNSKIWDTSNNCHNCPKTRKVWCNIALMHPKDADGMANSVDPDQTASSEAVWSWSALFAETYLSQYIEFVR